MLLKATRERTFWLADSKAIAVPSVRSCVPGWLGWLGQLGASWAVRAHARAAWAAWAARLGRLSRSSGPPGTPEPLESLPRVARADREDRPSSSETPFSTILGGFGGRFSSLSEDPSRARVDPQRHESNLCFCWQAQYFRGSAVCTKRPTILENRRTFTSEMHLDRAGRKTLDSFASGYDLGSILAASACSWTLLGAFSGVRGRLWEPSARSQGAPGTPRAAPETFPTSSQEVPKTCPRPIRGRS